MYKIIIQTKLFVSVSLCCRSATALKQQVSFLERTNNKTNNEQTSQYWRRFISIGAPVFRKWHSAAGSGSDWFAVYF